MVIVDELCFIPELVRHVEQDPVLQLPGRPSKGALFGFLVLPHSWQIAVDPTSRLECRLLASGTRRADISCEEQPWQQDRGSYRIYKQLSTAKPKLRAPGRTVNAGRAFHTRLEMPLVTTPCRQFPAIIGSLSRRLTSCQSSDVSL